MLAILTDPEVGGTFLSWTVNYLSGKTHYFSAHKNAVVDIPDTPLAAKNAHSFIANQVNNKTEFNQFFPLLLEKKESIYMHPWRNANGTQKAITTICEQASCVVAVVMPSDQALYRCKFEPRHDTSPAWTSQKKLSTATEMYDDFVDYFFPESKEKWKSENLTNVWDQREFMALNFNYFDHRSVLNYMDPQCGYHHINTVDLWTNFDQSVHDLFDYINIKIDNTRINQWTTVYYQWKKLHTNRLRFVWYFDTILDYIVRGVDFDLQRFHLDLSQEAAIQSALIYRHNLNVKTWQLLKFNNTKQLHGLLENNIHKLTR